MLWFIGFNFLKSTGHSHTVFLDNKNLYFAMRFYVFTNVYFSQNITAITFLQISNYVVFITEAQCISCEIITEFLRKI